MATIKYNNTELDYDAIELAALDGIEGFFNSMAYYKPGSKRKKYLDRRTEDYEALLNLLKLLRTGLDVVVTPSDISWNGHNMYFQDNSPSRRMAYYISEKMRGMPGKTKPKLSRASLLAELNNDIGNITDLNATYRNKTLSDSILKLLKKYTWEDLSGYDVEEGFDPIEYLTLLNNALEALKTPGTEDDAYAIGNRLGIVLPSSPSKSTYTGALNNLYKSLIEVGLSEDLITTIMQAALLGLALKVFTLWLKDNKLTTDTSTEQPMAQPTAQDKPSTLGTADTTPKSDTDKKTDQPGKSNETDNEKSNTDLQDKPKNKGLVKTNSTVPKRLVKWKGLVWNLDSYSYNNEILFTDDNQHQIPMPKDRYNLLVALYEKSKKAKKAAKGAKLQYLRKFEEGGDTIDISGFDEDINTPSTPHIIARQDKRPGLLKFGYSTGNALSALSLVPGLLWTAPIGSAIDIVSTLADPELTSKERYLRIGSDALFALPGSSYIRALRGLKRVGGIAKEAKAVEKAATAGNAAEKAAAAENAAEGATSLKDLKTALKNAEKTEKDAKKAKEAAEKKLRKADEKNMDKNSEEYKKIQDEINTLKNLLEKAEKSIKELNTKITNTKKLEGLGEVSFKEKAQALAIPATIGYVALTAGELNPGDFLTYEDPYSLQTNIDLTKGTVGTAAKILLASTGDKGKAAAAAAAMLGLMPQETLAATPRRGVVEEDLPQFRADLDEVNTRPRVPITIYGNEGTSPTSSLYYEVPRTDSNNLVIQNNNARAARGVSSYTRDPANGGLYVYDASGLNRYSLVLDLNSRNIDIYNSTGLKVGSFTLNDWNSSPTFLQDTYGLHPDINWAIRYNNNSREYLTNAVLLALGASLYKKYGGKLNYINLLRA